MTKLLDDGLQAVRKLSEERQDDAGEILLALASQDSSGVHLSEEQVERVRRVQRELADGSMKLATDEEMTALWKKCGL
jgi:hypothetical protein